MPAKLSPHLRRVFHAFRERRGRSRSTAKAGLVQNNGAVQFANHDREMSSSCLVY